jgi:hypothetical protein
MVSTFYVTIMSNTYRFTTVSFYSSVANSVAESGIVYATIRFVRDKNTYGDVNTWGNWDGNYPDSNDYVLYQEGNIQGRFSLKVLNWQGGQDVIPPKRIVVTMPLNPPPQQNTNPYIDMTKRYFVLCTGTVKDTSSGRILSKRTLWASIITEQAPPCFVWPKPTTQTKPPNPYCRIEVEKCVDINN